MTLQPVKWLGGVACPPSTFREHVRINRARGLPEIEPGEATSDRLYIVCSGPSLAETHSELESAIGCDVWALNGAYDWLIDQGHSPTYGVAQAPEAQVLNYLRKVRPADHFLLASQTHPDLVDRIIAKGGKITLWHSHCPDEWQVQIKPSEAVYGGGTIGLRALDLAYVLGYRDVHVLGFDACCSPDGRIAVDTPIYEDRRKDLRTFVVGGRAFVALPSHARQVEDFADVIRPLRGLEVTLYGDGLMQWSRKTTGASTSPMSA